MEVSENTKLSRREQNKAEKLERILTAARQLFREQGFEATTTRAIASKARIGTGTLFVYFPEKTDILFHLFRVDLERVSEQAVRSVPAAASAMDALMFVFEALFRFYDEDRKLSRVFIRLHLFGQGKASDEVSALSAVFLTRLGALVAARAPRAAGLDHFQTGYLLFGVYYFTLVAWLSHTIPDVETALIQLRHSLAPVLIGLEHSQVERDEHG